MGVMGGGLGRLSSLDIRTVVLFFFFFRFLFYLVYRPTYRPMCFSLKNTGFTFFFDLAQSSSLLLVTDGKKGWHR